MVRRIAIEGARREDLTDMEKWRGGSMVAVWVRTVEGIYYQVQEGVLPQELLDTHGATLLGTPYMKDVWPILKPDFRPDFAAYLEERFDLVP